MAECLHCRATGEVHGHGCAIAKKKGLTREEPPKAPLFVGAVVQIPSGKTWLAAIVTRLGDKDENAMRTFHPNGPDEDKEVFDVPDAAWRWPIR